MNAEQAIRLAETCDRFEWSWRIGEEPRIEDFLDQAIPGDRPQLLLDLIPMEIELRQERGEEISSREYRERYPDQFQLIETILDESEGSLNSPSLGSIGGYRLLEEIGRGAQGVVLRAADESGLAPREVAVKVLADGAIASPDHSRRFVEEVARLSHLFHSNIVLFLGSGYDRGQLFYAMRFIRGKSLAKDLKERGAAMAPYEAVRLFAPIVGAVNYLHQQGIVHRDLKPGNILLDEHGAPYVADFGLAFLLLGENQDPGASGTIPYIAPEQYDKRFGEMGPKSDVYSLGVILYEMLAGRPPFPRSREAILGTLVTEPLPPSRFQPGIPHDLERICLKCLSKSAKDRYDSEQLLENLGRYERREPLTDPPDGLWRRLRHQVKREPALYARLAVIIACSTIVWGYPLITGNFAPLSDDHWAKKMDWSNLIGWSGSVELILVLMNQAILIAWGMASSAFQSRLNRRKFLGGTQLGWRVVDVIAISLLILLDDALMSPLSVAFAVLIVASALSVKVEEVRQTTYLSMTGYTILACIYTMNHGTAHVYRHFHYLVGLACLGAMLAHQTWRTEALTRISESRNRA